MTDITHPTVHGHYAALVNQPGYYYLYALYADYRINNTWFSQQEYAALLLERLRMVQPALGMVQPYRKSPALRLFTERQSRERFPPEKAGEAWRQLRNLLEKAGPPPGWPDAPPPPSPRYRHALPDPPPESLTGSEGSSGQTPAAVPGGKKKDAPFPKSPVDYTMDV